MLQYKVQYIFVLHVFQTGWFTRVVLVPNHKNLGESCCMFWKKYYASVLRNVEMFYYFASVRGTTSIVALRSQISNAFRDETPHGELGQ